MDELLREILVDPLDHGPLEWRGQSLVNPRTKQSYTISPEGIPNLLVDEAVSVAQTIGSSREDATDVKKGKR